MLVTNLPAQLARKHRDQFALTFPIQSLVTKNPHDRYAFISLNASSRYVGSIGATQGEKQGDVQIFLEEESGVSLLS